MPICATDLTFNPTGTKRTYISKNFEQASEVVPLSDENEVAEKGEGAGMAARYARETNQLSVNST